MLQTSVPTVLQLIEKLTNIFKNIDFIADRRNIQ
jgi:hypothetical protein